MTNGMVYPRGYVISAFYLGELRLEQKIYMLSYGFDFIDDYDVNVAVFTDVTELKKAYCELITIREREKEERGYSIIHKVKIHEFDYINRLPDIDTVFDGVTRVNPETLGLKEDTNWE